MRIVLPPLKKDSYLVMEGWICEICEGDLCPGERIVMIPLEDLPSHRQFGPDENVPAHARCALKNEETSQGKITHIKDGDASPYPVVTENRKQWKFHEVRLDAEEDRTAEGEQVIKRLKEIKEELDNLQDKIGSLSMVVKDETLRTTLKLYQNVLVDGIHKGIENILEDKHDGK